MCRSTPARALMVVVVLVGSAACTARGGLQGFTPAGRPVPLPPPGSLQAVTEADFEGMLVGVRGTPVVVNIWASWCGPCRVEMPLLQRAAKRYEGAVVFVGVNSRDDQGPAEDFLRRYKITYPNVFDGSGAIRRRLELRGFPTTYVFDRTGALQSSLVGGISEQTLAAQVRAARRT